MRHRLVGALLAGVVIALPIKFSWSAEQVDVEKEKALLISGHPADQQAAIIRLANAGDAGTSALLQVIENEKDAMAKARAGRSLQEAAKKTENRTKKFFQQVRRVAENPSAAVSEQGLMAAMSMKGDPEALALLRRMAKSRKEPQLRAQTLGMLLVNTDRDRAEIPFVATFLDDPSDYVRVWAAGYLGELGDKRALPFINQVLQRRPDDNKARALIMRAAIAAGRIGDTSSIPLLEEIGKSSAYGVAQWDAVLAVKEIELKRLARAEARNDYLRTALNQPTYCRWAALKLAEQKGAASERILREGAKSKDAQVSSESTRALLSLGVEAPGHQ